MKEPAKDRPAKRIVNSYVKSQIADRISKRAEALDFTVTKYASYIIEYWDQLGSPGVHPLEDDFVPPEFLTLPDSAKKLLNYHEIGFLARRAEEANVSFETFVTAIIDDWFTKGTPSLPLESPKKEAVNFARRDPDIDPDLPGEVAEKEFPYNEAQSVQLVGKVLHELNIPMEKAELALRMMILHFVEKHDEIRREKPPENGT